MDAGKEFVEADDNNNNKEPSPPALFVAVVSNVCAAVAGGKAGGGIFLLAAISLIESLAAITSLTTIRTGSAAFDVTLVALVVADIVEVRITGKANGEGGGSSEANGDCCGGGVNAGVFMPLCMADGGAVRAAAAAAALFKPP